MVDFIIYIYKDVSLYMYICFCESHVKYVSISIQSFPKNLILFGCTLASFVQLQQISIPAFHHFTVTGVIRLKHCWYKARSTKQPIVNQPSLQAKKFILFSFIKFISIHIFFNSLKTLVNTKTLYFS